MFESISKIDTRNRTYYYKPEVHVPFHCCRVGSQFQSRHLHSVFTETASGYYDQAVTVGGEWNLEEVETNDSEIRTNARVSKHVGIGSYFFLMPTPTLIFLFYP